MEAGAHCPMCGQWVVMTSQNLYGRPEWWVPGHSYLASPSGWCEGEGAYTDLKAIKAMREENDGRLLRAAHP